MRKLAVAPATARDPDLTPAAVQWCSVEAPGVSKKYLLPVLVRDMTPEHRRRYMELWRLADRHRATIVISRQS
jgi:hypothetical protein